METNIKKAIESAEKELKKEQQNKTKEEVKSIIKAILEKLEKAQEKRQEAVKEIQIHKKMLDYLKKGNLKKIKEMLETDEFARKVAVIIIKEKETIREKETLYPYPYSWTNPWDRWHIIWNDSSNDYITTNMFLNEGNGIMTGMAFRRFADGSYQCSSGKVYHISR